MTADLAEEHSTSTLATERLEAETADRLRLEKELQDVQVKNCSIETLLVKLDVMFNLLVVGTVSKLLFDIIELI